MSNNYDSDGAYITLLVGKEHVEATLLSVVTLEDNNGNKDDQHGIVNHFGGDAFLREAHLSLFSSNVHDHFF
ncbi:hypothetical protein VNO77_27530 [Canavalia gladiata]|uniref:Uncharacterized protein n=1 Tax=Canavalia gladiata TaxID=3824 RepID=A0AAN9KX43_CANGL